MMVITFKASDVISKAIEIEAKDSSNEDFLVFEFEDEEDCFGRTLANLLTLLKVNVTIVE